MKLINTSTTHDERPLRPAQAVLHPAWLMAVFVLVVNDHMLKPAAFAELFTGKISDFAGLFFFPVLLAAICGVRTRRGVVLSGVATAVVFSAINLSPSIAGLFDQFVSNFFGFVTTPDPTDLVALVAIPAGIATFLPLMVPRNSRSVRRGLEAFALLVGASASMATSEPCDEFCEGQVPNQSSHVSILNKSNELQVLRIRRLRDEIGFDCERVTAEPNLYLSDAVFGPAEVWWVQSGQEIPVQTLGIRQCEIALIESDTAPEILVAFNAADMQMRSYAFDADIPYEVPADDQTLVLDADYSRANQSQMHGWRERGGCGERADLCSETLLAPLATVPEGARYFWRSQYETDLHFPRTTTSNTGTLSTVAPECQLDTRGDSIVWEDPLRSEVFIDELVEGRDGCHELIYADSVDAETTAGWWVCAPFESLKLISEAPAGTRISMNEQNNYFGDATPGAGYEALEISILQNDETGASLNQIWMMRGSRPPSEVDFKPTFEPADGCDVQQTQCGQIARAVRVGSEIYDFNLAAGESATAGEVLPVTVFVSRAQEYYVTDSSCGEVDASGLLRGAEQGPSGYFEAVIVRND